MQETSFNNNISTNTQLAAPNTQINAAANDAQKQAQNTSIFGQKNSSKPDVNQSNSNSGGTGGLDNIFGNPNNFTAASPDNTSIFSGLNRSSQYTLYSKKDTSYDVPKLTQEDIANQKPAEGPKRTNPKAYNIDMTPKANPYEAFRNPEIEEKGFMQGISEAFSNIFGTKKSF